MTTETVGQERHERTVTTRRRGLFTAPPVHLSWGAIFAGTVVALAAWALLYAFGLAVGLTAIDPQSPSSLRASGVFTGIWSLVIPIVALFIGGAVASRGADVVTTLGGALHGLAVWGLVTVIGAWLFTSIVLSVLGSVGSAAAMAGPALGGAWLAQGKAAAVETMTRPYEWEAADALGPVNQRLQAEGRAPMRPEQIGAIAVFVVEDALRTGELNRETAVQSITRSTPLTRAEAETVANRLEARWNESKRSAQVAALQAAEATGRAFWGVFGVLALSLMSALAGSMIGVAKRPRTAAGPSAVTSPPTVPHEVHA
jgi:hypothetical protein